MDTRHRTLASRGLVPSDSKHGRFVDGLAMLPWKYKVHAMFSPSLTTLFPHKISIVEKSVQDTHSKLPP